MERNTPTQGGLPIGVVYRGTIEKFYGPWILTEKLDERRGGCWRSQPTFKKREVNIQMNTDDMFKYTESVWI